MTGAPKACTVEHGPRVGWVKRQELKAAIWIASTLFGTVGMVGAVNFRATVNDLINDLERIRHQLHQRPEVGLHLPRTQDLVLTELENAADEVTLGKDLSSVVAVIRGRGPRRRDNGPAVLLRADMDALPVLEELDVAYRSEIDGVMHACGHDLHTAMLLGAAKMIWAQRNDLNGDVVLMFQPGEEGWDGARFMVEEGVLEAAGRRVDAAYALHVFSALVPGKQFVSRPGTLLAASDTLTVTVHGSGGHGSMPHLTRDLNSVLANMITALETMVAREFDIFDPVVMTVGLIKGGTKANVIAHSASFEATVRTFSTTMQTQVERSVRRVIEGVASARGVEVTIDYKDEYPVTVNAATEYEFASRVVRESVEDATFTPMKSPLPGAEDFSRVLSEVPGCMLGLGAVPEGRDPATAPYNHSSTAEYSDAVLPVGAAVYAELAFQRIDAGLSEPA